MPPQLRLSVLDQSPIAEGSTGAQALRNTLDLARIADVRGYHRYWLAEHHGGVTRAGASPEALVGPIAASTSRIRVGSGGVMLPHYSPFKVAEAFSVLSGLFPGRIDLGLGRTDGADDPLIAFALQRDRNHRAPDDFGDQLWELLSYLDGRMPADHLFAGMPAMLPGRPESPEPWLLGSSSQSAIWAAELGLPYAFADFINPAAGPEVVKLYRERFIPSKRLGEPSVMVAVSSLCAHTDGEAERLTASSTMMTMLARRGKLAPVPRVDTALRFIDRRSRGQAARSPSRKRMLYGAPDALRADLQSLADDYGASELLILTVAHDDDARRRSYELIAEAFSLTPLVTAA